MSRLLIVLVLIPFTALSAVASWQHGYFGVLRLQLQTTYGLQVYADLCISLGLAMIWMWHDARASKRVLWPWIAITLVAGVFGPLLYLLTRRPAASAA